MPYLISYLAVGFFLAIAAVLHNTFARDKALLAFAFTFIFWPIVVLFAPESFLRSDRLVPESTPIPQDLLKEKLATLKQTEGSFLTEEERQRLTKASKYGEAQISFFGNNSDFHEILSKYWALDIPPEIYRSFNKARLHLDEEYDPESQPLFSLRSPDWYIGLSNEFVKSIAKADRKKQGRILDAIAKISAAPIEVYGDTIKPLTGNLAGLWRCRLGDDRLIYYPDIESKKVILIIFSSRGEAYKEMPDVSALTKVSNSPRKVQ